MVKARILPGGDVREVRCRKGVTVAKLLEELGLPRSASVVVRNGKVLAEDDVVAPEDDVDVYVVVSYG